MNITVKVTGAGDIEARLRGLRQELESRRRAAMHRAVILLRDEARSRVYSPAGRARRAIRFDEQGAGETLRGIIRARGAARFSQTGRPAGKAPKIRRIQSWLRRTGQDVSRAKAFLIARAIGQRGTEGHPIMEEAAEAKRAQVVALFREAIERALRRG